MAATFTSLQLTPALARKRCPLSYADRQAQWAGVGERELQGNQAQPGADVCQRTLKAIIPRTGDLGVPRCVCVCEHVHECVYLGACVCASDSPTRADAAQLGVGWAGLACPESPALGSDTCDVGRTLTTHLPQVLTQVPPFTDPLSTPGAYVD